MCFHFWGNPQESPIWFCFLVGPVGGDTRDIPQLIWGKINNKNGESSPAMKKYRRTYIWPNHNIFTNLDFPEIRGPISLPQLPFGVRSCEVAIIWPDTSQKSACSNRMAGKSRPKVRAGIWKMQRLKRDCFKMFYTYHSPLPLDPSKTWARKQMGREGFKCKVQLLVKFICDEHGITNELAQGMQQRSNEENEC